MLDDDLLFGELVYEELDTPSQVEDLKHYATWKRELEGILGRELQPTEATTMYDMISGRAAL